MLRGSAKTVVGVSKIFDFEREEKLSAETIRLTLKKQDLKAMKRETKIKFSKAHRKDSFNWVLDRENELNEDWKRLVQSN